MSEGIRALIVSGAVCNLLFAPLLTHAQTSTVTTSSYDTTSTSEDISKSCAKLSVDSTGTVSGDCNSADSDGAVTASQTTLDVAQYLTCVATSWGTQLGYGIDWGTPDSDYTINNYTLSTTSSGNGYLLSATCNGISSLLGLPIGWWAKTVDLSDTTSGLKNDGGDFAKH